MLNTRSAATSQFRSAESVNHHFGTWRAFPKVVGAMEALRRTYGKDNRVLRTARLSQSFKVVSASLTWQSAGISTGGAKIGVTRLWNSHSETGIEQGEQKS
jgi:hypothetical protein